LDKLFELLINRKAQLDDLMDKQIANLNQIAGRRAEIEEMLHAITKSAEIATHQQTQEVVDGLTTLAQLSTVDSSEAIDPLGGTSPKVARVAPYTGVTAEVWKPKKKGVTNGDV
jgi:hypothetical protein